MRLLYLSLLLLLFISACQCHDNYKCSTEMLQVYFVGFAPGEADTVTIKRYANDGTYTQLIDSSVKWRDTPGSDTLFSGIFVEEGYDYALSLPGYTYKISDIKSEGKYYENIKHGCSDKTLPLCFNRLVSYRLDAAEHNVQHNSGNTEVPGIYITK
ncbi:MAG: hypothetical protein BGO69_16400 [Bacteroidetes bacterium 46-16]|nr:MAG: hypothetical protein BGO69_16400 [Bacteroidetes bacterium 46-16]